MPEKQPKTGVSTVNRVEPRLRGAEVIPMVFGYLGGTHLNETVAIPDEVTFFREFMPEIVIGEHAVPLGPERLPLPRVLAEYVLSQPGSPLRELRALAAQVDSASPNELNRIAARLSQALIPQD